MPSAPVLSLRQAADRCGVSPSRLRRLAAAGVLKAHKAGAYWVVLERDLSAFMTLDRRRGRPPAQPQGRRAK